MAAAAAQADAAVIDDVDMVGSLNRSRIPGVKAKIMKKSGGGGVAGRLPASAGAASTGETRKKRKNIKLRKGIVVKGIKIKDAASKKLAMEALQAAREDEEGGMES